MYFVVMNYVGKHYGGDSCYVLFSIRWCG